MRELSVYQYKSHPLVQITNGRLPLSQPEHAKKWVLRHTVPSTADGVASVATIAPSKVLEVLGRTGYLAIEGFEISEAWQAKWVAPNG